MLAKLTSSQRSWLSGAALFLLTCLVYLPVLHGGFVWDDTYMVTDNQSLRDLGGLHTIWFTTKFADPYRLTMSAFWLQWQLWGAHAVGYHIVTVITHGIGVILLWRLLKKLNLPGAWLAAAVFAVHPVGVATAAWISEQKNTWSLIFFLLTLLSYLRFDSNRGKGAYTAALIFYICALMSKGSVVVLPGILLLIVWWQRKKLVRKDFFLTAPFFFLSAIASYITIWFQDNRAIGGETVQDINFAGRLAASAWAVWFYLWKGLCPVYLSAIYPRWAPDPSSVLAWLPLFALLAITVLFWKYRKTWGRHGLFALGYFLAALFPVLGFFNMYYLVFSRVADHWQYLGLIATVATAVSIATYWFRVLSKKHFWPEFTGSIIAVVVLLFLGVNTFLRAEVYTSEYKLWNDTVHKNPKAWMAFNNLGNALGNQNRTDEAISAYRAAIALNPGFPDAHSNLGNSLVSQQKFDEAIDHFKIAVANQPKMASFHFNYGIALFDKGRYQDAVDQYNIALGLNPGYADVRNNLANVYLKQEKYPQALEQALIASQIKPNAPEPHINAAMALTSLNRPVEAAAHFEAAIKLKSDSYAVHHEYGMMLAMQGKLAEALPHFQALVRLKPDDAASYSNIGNALAGLKRLDEALVAYQTALRLQPDDAQTHNNIANVLMEQGKFDQAIDHYKFSIQHRPEDPETHLNYSIALQRQGNKAAALQEAREALRLRPNDSNIQRHFQSLSK